MNSLRSLGKSMGEPLITQYLKTVDKKEKLLKSCVNDVSLAKNDHEKLESICFLTKEIRKLSNK